MSMGLGARPAARDRPRRLPPRRRQDRHPGRHPQQARQAHARGVEGHPDPPAARLRAGVGGAVAQGSAAGDPPPPRADRRRRLSRPGWPAPTSRSRRGSSPSPTCGTRSRPIAPTARAGRPTWRWPTSGTAPAPTSIPRSSTRSCGWSPAGASTTATKAGTANVAWQAAETCHEIDDESSRSGLTLACASIRGDARSPLYPVRRPRRPAPPSTTPCSPRWAARGSWTSASRSGTATTASPTSGSASIDSGDGFRESHIAFEARDRATVAPSSTPPSPPAPRCCTSRGCGPSTTPRYYGAFVRDPDGNNVEAVCHLPE